MTLKILEERFSICRLDSVGQVDLEKPFTFLSVTDEEISLVCPEEHVPRRCLKRENGWRALKVQGVLDFSLTGILAGLSGVLAENGIAVLRYRPLIPITCFVGKLHSPWLWRR